MRIGRDGEWFHDDEEVTHPGVLADLRDRLRVDAGGHYLEAGPVRVPVEVEAAPYAIVRVEREGDRLILTSTTSRASRSPRTRSASGPTRRRTRA